MQIKPKIRLMVTKATNKSTAGKGAAEAVSIFKTCK